MTRTINSPARPHAAVLDSPPEGGVSSGEVGFSLVCTGPNVLQQLVTEEDQDTGVGYDSRRRILRHARVRWYQHPKALPITWAHVRNDP
jgi:hypothetical protein